MTLVVSSHILSELDEYSTDMLVIRDGRVLSHDLIEQQSSATISLKITLAEPRSGLQDILSGLPCVSFVEGNDRVAIFSFNSDALDQHCLLKNLLDQGMPVCRFAEQQSNMQSVYLKSVSDEEQRGAIQ
jgi:ABC-2 type transport system ATP-binding protein